MGNDLEWRLLRQRIAGGQAAGVLCRPEEVEGWLARLAEIPLLRVISDRTASYYTGAVVTVCTNADEALRFEGRRPRTVIWIDPENLLDAPLPGRKQDR